MNLGAYRIPNRKKLFAWKNVRATHIQNTTNTNSRKCWSSDSGSSKSDSSPAKTQLSFGIWRWPFICPKALSIYMRIHVFWKLKACLKFRKSVRYRTQSKRTHERMACINRNLIPNFQKLQVWKNRHCYFKYLSLTWLIYTASLFLSAQTASSWK